MFTRLRPRVANWEQAGEAQPGSAAGAGPRDRPAAGAAGRVHQGRCELACFSLVTTVGTSQDATLQELRVESFFPADERTRRHAWTQTPGLCRLGHVRLTFEPDGGCTMTCARVLLVRYAPLQARSTENATA
jgi:hypothetical protein